MSTPFAITLGDPCGIGPEVVAKLFARMTDRRPAIAVGDAGALASATRRCGLALQVRTIDSPERARFERGTVEVIQAGPVLPADLPLGRVDARAGRSAFEAVAAAIALARSSRVRAIVTAPLSKEAMKAAGVGYPGHTEILADLGGASDVRMMLMNGQIRMVLATIHVSLSEVPSLIELQRELTTIRLAHQAARQLGIEQPRVAVAGLNPHAGENGLFGREEIEVIAPAIARARASGIDTSGPWPGDTVFMRARQGDFDIVVAQYHDQGLIPIKYLGIDQGVNITLGLPFVRTSVDHGTAFDIAGKGRADPSSLEAALRQAAILTAGADDEARS